MNYAVVTRNCYGDVISVKYSRCLNERVKGNGIIVYDLKKRIWVYIKKKPPNVIMTAFLGHKSPFCERGSHDLPDLPHELSACY